MTDWNAPILVVDADAEARTRAAHVLARAGLPVLELESGEAALAAALEQPAAVVLEVTLPDVDGFEVCRALRERHGDELPVIFVSAERTTPHDRVAGLLLGADDYLVKPVNGDELLIRVRRLLARARPHGSSETGRADSLSPRELQILRLLADGHSAAAIADRLVISH
jgi:DNA-binding response OmpR family regulator